MIDAAGRLLRRPVIAGLALLLVYVALSFAMDTHGFLGSDTGGKVAALEQMDRTGSFDPDVGYWASQWDPEGTFHPQANSFRVDDKYVNITSLPMVLVAEPLYRVGGYRLALLLPMLGAVATAFACRGIAERVRAGSGWWAFWLVGLASPMAIYALDFWEHSLGVAMICWGVVVALDAVLDRATVGRGLAAGFLFGAGFSMRTEALAYAAGTLAVVCLVVLFTDRKLLGPVKVGAAAVVGVGISYLANQALERAVYGGTVRGGRTSGLASEAGANGSARLRDGLLTTFSLRPDSANQAIFVGVLAAGFLALGVWYSRRRDADRRVTIALFAVVAYLYVARIAVDGLGFIPGVLAAAPLAVVGAVLAWSSRAGRIVAAIALGVIPLVWAFQYRGALVAQWGGRYLLASGVLLMAVGCARLAVLDKRIVAFVVGLSLVVTGVGVVWLGQRSRQIDTAGRDLLARPEPVLISDLGFFLREMGPRALDRRWLTIPEPVSDAERARAFSVVEQAGYDEVAFLVEGDNPTLPTVPGWSVTGEQVYTWLDVPFTVATYRANA